MRANCVILAMISLMGCSLSASSANADDGATQQTTSPSAEKKLEADLLNARLTAINAAARLSPVEGKATVTNVSIEAEVLAQGALTEIANQIASRICNIFGKDNVKKLVIYDSAAADAVVNYRVLITQLTRLSDAYAELLSDAYTAPARGDRILTDISTAVAAAVGVLSLLNNETAIVGTPATKDEVALVTEIVRAVSGTYRDKLRSGGNPVKSTSANECKLDAKVLYPAIYFSKSIGSKDTGVISKLKELDERRGKAVARLAELKKKPDENKDKIERFESLNVQVEALSRQLSAINEKSGLSWLFSLLRGEALTAQFDEKTTTKILFLKIIAQGGNNRTSRNLISTKVDHSGGSLVSYALLDDEGTIDWAETLHYYNGYISGEEISEGPLRHNFKR